MEEGKTVDSTAIENNSYKIFPNDLNTNGTLFGGLVMAELDRLALIVAERHSGVACATVSVDALHFLAPAHMGEILVFSASLNRAWGSSMEIGLRVVAENYETKERRHVVSAYYTFVAIGADHKPKKVPPVIPETSIQTRRYKEADQRRKNRLEQAKIRKSYRSESDESRS